MRPDGPQLEKLVFVEPNLTGQLDSNGALPFSSRLTDRIPMVVQPNAHQELPNKAGFNLVRPTKAHGRAFDIRFGEQDNYDPQIVFGDPYGNIFTSLGTKGNDCRRVTASDSPAEPSSLRIMGMQDATSIPGVMKVSERLRAAGVDTEWIVASRRPKQFPRFDLDTQTFTLQALRLFKHSIRTDTAESGPEFEGPYTPRNIQNLDSVEFAVTYRALKTPFRLCDIEKASGETTPLQIMHSVITAHNLEEGIQTRRDTSYEPVIIEQTPEGYQKYITEILPRRIGQNIARMHNLGMWHRYLHPGNVSLLGGIYDLDSVHCPDLFPEEDNLSVTHTAYDLIHFATFDGGNRLPTWFIKISTAIFPEGEMFEDFRTLAINLFNSYLAERDFSRKEETKVVFAAGLTEVITMDGEFCFEHLPDSYTDRINELFNEQFASYINTGAGVINKPSGIDISATLNLYEGAPGEVHFTAFMDKNRPEFRAMDEAYNKKLKNRGYKAEDRKAILAACNSLRVQFIRSKLISQNYPPHRRIPRP